jgi:hypothetical protein
MGKYADMVLSGDFKDEPEKPSEDKPADGLSPIDMIMGTADLIQREFTPRENEISTITNEPVMDYTPTGQPSTKLSALAKSGFVDDPKGKIKIFAKSRGIPEDRYSIYKGEIVYQGDDGKWYPETKKTIGGKVREIVGESPAFLPSGILAGAGATVGPGSAFMGAAGGEGLRQYIGDKMTGTETDPKEGLLKMGLSGLTGLLGMTGGKTTNRTLNSIGAKRGGLLASHAGRNRKLIDIQATKRLERMGEDVGVDLFPPQTTGSKALADKFNLLGDLEPSSPIIQAARKKQHEQIDNAVNAFLDAVSPDMTPGNVGRRLKTASTSAIDAADAARTKTASKVYKSAFKNAKPVDVGPVVKQIAALKSDLPESGSKARTIVGKIEKMLFKQGDDGPVPQTDIRVLDNVKKEIDVLLTGPDSTSVHKDVIRRLTSIKDSLVKQADKASPEYKKARKLYGDLSPSVDRLKDSKIGDMSRLKKQNTIEQAARKLFSNIGSTPESISYAKAVIKQRDPEAWNGAIRTHLQEIFERTKSSAGGVDATTNIGGHFFKRTWGDPKQRKILRAAMEPDQFDYFRKLTTVLDRAGMILRKESATATRQEMIDEIGGSMLRRSVRAATRPMVTKERVIADMLVKARLGQNAKALANAMVSRKHANQLNKMYQLSPRSEKLIPMLSTFAAVIAGGELKSSHVVKKAEAR